MDEYSKLLMLTYFNQYKERYILFDLIKILGVSYKRLDTYLEQLIEELLIQYEEGIIKLTEKAQRILISHDMNNYSYNDVDYLQFKIDKSKAWDITKTYTPKKFLTKI